MGVIAKIVTEPVGFKRIPVPFRVPHSPESRRRGRRGKVRGLPIRPKADYLKEVGYEINDEAASLYMADNKRDYTRSLLCDFLRFSFILGLLPTEFRVSSRVGRVLCNVGQVNLVRPGREQRSPNPRVP